MSAPLAALLVLPLSIALPAAVVSRLSFSLVAALPATRSVVFQLFFSFSDVFRTLSDLHDLVLCFPRVFYLFQLVFPLVSSCFSWTMSFSALL